ncbi:glycosyltransferase family A protein [Ekhidna lutea]|uniref:glycosyltransferase family A protein n=1 Tax=Ekhidna lutea TaxID=447679 RepID=UPI00117FBDCD|nr:glycosyltransferase family A protein [Ekhidna lutea]
MKKTLAKNLEDNRSLKDKIEFVLVDFSLDENVCSWIWNDFSEEIREGYLKFYQTNQLRKWSAPIAKNTSHKLANGEILTNLDCDNYVGANGAEFVIDQFKKANEAIILWQYSGIKYDGSFGRISIPSKVFKELGGYDESLLEMGWQDNDLMRRSKAMGLKLVKISDRKFNQAIAHEKYKPESMSFEQMNKLNEKHARRKIRKGQLVANAGNFGIANGMLKMNAEGKMKPTIASL